MPTYTPATEQMRDVLREGRFRTEPFVQHVLAMHLMAQEASAAVWIAGWNGVRSPRDIARDVNDSLRHRALVRSYEGRLRVVAERAALKVAA